MMWSTILYIVTDLSWIVTAFLGLSTFFLVKHLLLVRSLPPGPFPLPILGNLLELKGMTNGLPSVIEKYQKKYKDIFTLWLGSQPTIVICNWELSHEALITKRNDFSGRVARHSLEAFLGGHQDVAFADFGPTWETLRKIMTAAVRKYAVSDNLAELVRDVVDSTVDVMLKEGKAVDSSTYVYLITYNILASSSFGKRFEIDDPEFVRLRKNNDEANEKFGVGLPSDAVPLLKIFYRKRLAELMEHVRVFFSYLEEKFLEHQKTYQRSDIRDFTDSILAAKEEAEAEGKECLQYLTEGNMLQILADLFSAGTDTSRAFLQWTLLLICTYPEIQTRMQAEIDQNIGTRDPRQKDKANCPFVNAVLTEVLRFRHVTDLTLEHKTTCDTQLDNYRIPKNTSCLFYIKGPHNDASHWDEPHKFKPERFLDKERKFLNTRITGYLPFGLGRRACPGEKLALANAFLVVARLLQRHSFELECGPGSVPLSFETNTFNREAPPYKLIVKKRC